MPGIALEIRRKCKVCGKVFIAKTLDSQFCCKRCGDVFRKRQLDAKKEKKLCLVSSFKFQMPENTSRSRKLLLSLELNETPSTGLLGKEESQL